MNRAKLLRTAAMAAVPILATTTVILTPAISSASTAAGVHHAQHSCYRQLVGTVDSPAYLEASTPAAGTYTIEYDITGTAFFDTYVNNTELGYVGGSSGVYRTRTVKLPAGGVLIQVAGPEGSGQANVYLDKVC